MVLLRHTLVSRKMSSKLATKEINYIKSKLLKGKLFKLMCEDIADDFYAFMLPIKFNKF